MFYDPATGVSTALNACGNRGEACCAWHCRDYETQQVWGPSGDGCTSRCFLAAGVALRRDGRNELVSTSTAVSILPLPPFFRQKQQPGWKWAASGRSPICVAAAKHGSQWQRGPCIRRNKQVTFDDRIVAARMAHCQPDHFAHVLGAAWESNGGLTAAGNDTAARFLRCCCIHRGGRRRLLRFTVGQRPGLALRIWLAPRTTGRAGITSLLAVAQRRREPATQRR